MVLAVHITANIQRIVIRMVASFTKTMGGFYLICFKNDIVKKFFLIYTEEIYGTERTRTMNQI
jgi:hypothetical protein